MGYAINKRWEALPVATCGEADCGWSTEWGLSEREVDRLADEHYEWHDEQWALYCEAIEAGWNRVMHGHRSIWPIESSLPIDGRQVIYVRRFAGQVVAIQGEATRLRVNLPGFNPLGDPLPPEGVPTAEIRAGHQIPIDTIEAQPPERDGDYWRYT